MFDATIPYDILFFESLDRFVQAEPWLTRDRAKIDTIPDFKGAFGAKGKVDPVRRLIGAAAAWGGNPNKDAVYLNVTPAKNDGTTVYKVTVKDVPVDAFWSISVYNAEGYYQKNELTSYTINSITGKRGTDGSITVQFGGCDGKIPNCIPIVTGWNYPVRLYRPRPEILNGQWTFPELSPRPECARETGRSNAASTKMPHDTRMHLTGCSELRPPLRLPLSPTRRWE